MRKAYLLLDELLVVLHDALMLSPTGSFQPHFLCPRYRHQHIICTNNTIVLLILSRPTAWHVITSLWLREGEKNEEHKMSSSASMLYLQEVRKES